MNSLETLALCTISKLTMDLLKLNVLNVYQLKCNDPSIEMMMLSVCVFMFGEGFIYTLYSLHHSLYLSLTETLLLIREHL